MASVIYIFILTNTYKVPFPARHLYMKARLFSSSACTRTYRMSPRHLHHVIPQPYPGDYLSLLHDCLLTT